jgi:hypothetical protein
MPGMRRVALILVLVAASAGCGGPTVDLATGLEVLDFSSGWHDEGIVDGQNKLVPSATFKLKNISDQNLPVLEVNAVFRRPDETQELGAAYFPVTRSEGLAPGAVSKPVAVKSAFGYKGSEPRNVMLENRLFVDAKVEIFAKYSSLQWKRIAEYPIERKLITQ